LKLLTLSLARSLKVGLAIGTASWCVGLALLRCTDWSKLWALCHITWHVVPAFAGANLFLALREGRACS
jgi:hypothetical protein